MIGTVWKFPIVPGAPDRIEVPTGSRFLTLRTQQDAPMTWWLVDPHARGLDRYRIKIIGTGWPPDPDVEHMSYLGTFEVGGVYVFHVFAGQLD